MLILLLLLFILHGFNAVYLYDDEETTYKPHIATFEDLDFEPIVPLTKDKEKLIVGKNINCNDFSKYALNCTAEAALIYNSTRKSPPMPAKIGNWCRAIRHLTNCAIDWNSDCKDVTENHFNEESIKGHMHVLSNVCDDEWFLSQIPNGPQGAVRAASRCVGPAPTKTPGVFLLPGYDDLPQCIETAAADWETCYTIFKATVDEQKNSTQEWTHFETHFYLCCARTQFRRCTLTTLFEPTPSCSYSQAVILQKFSVIVSEGDVYQDCEHNMMYPNCPGGDPRPSEKTLNKLMNAVSLATNQYYFNYIIFLVLWVLKNCVLLYR